MKLTTFDKEARCLERFGWWCDVSSERCVLHAPTGRYSE